MQGNSQPPPPASTPESPAQPTASDETERDVLRLVAEEASVSKRTVEKGRVRVTTVTHTRDHQVDELLALTSVEVERIPVGRVIDAIPPVRQEAGLTIVPVVEETVVVDRRLVLKEELHIRRRQTTERFQQTVPLRYQTAHVTRIPAPGSPSDAEAAGPFTHLNPEDN
jgi:uncharacterized protein (TIGR02271 family)